MNLAVDLSVYHLSRSARFTSMKFCYIYVFLDHKQEHITFLHRNYFLKNMFENYDKNLKARWIADIFDC